MDVCVIKGHHLLAVARCTAWHAHGSSLIWSAGDSLQPAWRPGLGSRGEPATLPLRAVLGSQPPRPPKVCDHHPAADVSERKQQREVHTGGCRRNSHNCHVL